MTKFKYLKLTKTKRIRYLMNFKRKNTYLVFLHGFKSDLEGQKPKTFLRFAKKNNLGFLGIGSAPEFLEHLMWRKFTKKN